MKLLILILFPLNLFAQVWVDTIYFSDRGGGIRYRGTWIDADYGKISDKNTEGSELFYRAWMGGFDVYTYVDGHHGGYWINVDGNRTYVDLTEEPRAIKKTFSVNNLSYDNHNITITPEPDSTFVFEKIVKYVDFSPLEPPCVDTIYFDSIRWETKINWIDKTRWIEKDTTIINYKDSTILHHVYDTTGSRIDTFFIMPKKITFELK